MPNTWEYALSFDRRDVDGFAQRVRQLPALWERLGYRTIGDAMITPSGDEVLLGDATLIPAELERVGGAVTLWREDDDLDLTVGLESATIGISVTHDLRRERPGDGATAERLREWFRAAVGELSPHYGWSSDEWRVEAAWRDRDGVAEWAGLCDDVEASRPPRLLFWVNYFSRAYWERVREAVERSSLDGRVEPFAKGMRVTLAEAPWDARVAELDASGVYRIR